jgi:tRNA 2-selenouridine synthase
MVKTLEIEDFLELSQQELTLDVRAPKEYAAGHIPHAVSFPLFSDEERAEVGTLYKQKGKEKALIRGLELVGPKMAGFVREVQRICPNKKLAVHCWRGGQRSGSMAWLFSQAGFEVYVLSGGYKAYRHYVLSQFEKNIPQLVVLGGRTGAGKTHILHALKEAGEQVIDLEGLANHKGSAFGDLGEPAQPTVEHFENLLETQLRALDKTRVIWVENESKNIGRVYVPDAFFKQMKHTTLLNIEIPDQERLQNLVDDYCNYGQDVLEAAFRKIERKLGGQNLKQALEFVQEGNFKEAAKIALFYYDKTYQHGLDTNPSPDIRLLKFDHRNPQIIAQNCISEIYTPAKQHASS